MSQKTCPVFIVKMDKTSWTPRNIPWIGFSRLGGSFDSHQRERERKEREKKKREKRERRGEKQRGIKDKGREKRDMKK